MPISWVRVGARADDERPAEDLFLRDRLEHRRRGMGAALLHRRAQVMRTRHHVDEDVGALRILRGTLLDADDRRRHVIDAHLTADDLGNGEEHVVLTNALRRLPEIDEAFPLSIGRGRSSVPRSSVIADRRGHCRAFFVNGAPPQAFAR